ncbi:unnamed protein product [Ectocarpus sp. CCAP 1310/34]|nr:unnamed protein product [Ectocarpus sp. CCAP 1310/34]
MKKKRRRPDQVRSGTETSSEKDRDTPNLEEAPARRYLRLGTQTTRTTKADPPVVFTPRRRDTGDNMGCPVREVDGRDIQATAGVPSRAGNSGPLGNTRLLLPSPAPPPPPPAPEDLPPAPSGEPNIFQPPDPAPQQQAPSPPPAAPEAPYSLSWDDLLGAVNDDDEPHAQAVPWAGVIDAPLMPAGPAPSRLDLLEVGPLKFAESPAEKYGGHQEGGIGIEQEEPAEAAEGDNHEQQGGDVGEAAAPDAAPVSPVEPARRIGSRMRRPSRRLIESLPQA